MEHVLWKMPTCSVLWFGGILKPWTTRAGVAKRDVGQVRTAHSGGTGHHLSLGSSCHRNVPLKSTCTLSPRRVFFLAQCTSNALQGKIRSVVPIFGRIITSKSWNLCNAADLWNIRRYMETTITKILWSFTSYFWFCFSLNIYKRVLQDDRIIAFQSFRPFRHDRGWMQDSGWAGAPCLTHTATRKPGVHQVSALCLHSGLSTQNYAFLHLPQCHYIFQMVSYDIYMVSLLMLTGQYL